MKMDVSTSLLCWPWPVLYSFSYNSVQFSGKTGKKWQAPKAIKFADYISISVCLFLYSYAVV